MIVDFSREGEGTSINLSEGNFVRISTFFEKIKKIQG
jgi:hypothetical protein